MCQISEAGITSVVRKYDIRKAWLGRYDISADRGGQGSIVYYVGMIAVRKE